MTHIEHDASLVCVTRKSHRVWLQLGIATALTTGLLFATSAAQARIKTITIQTRGVAFGGYSFPGVGQYEKITGYATGEIDPNDPQNAVITDIKIAPRNSRAAAPFTKRRPRTSTGLTLIVRSSVDQRRQFPPA